MENKCTCYFSTQSPAQWCTSGIVQRVYLSRRKRSVKIAHEATSAPLAGRRHASRTRAVLVLAWCWWATRSAFICYICSLLKVFYQLVDLSLMHGACSILCQISRWTSADLTPSGHRKRTTARRSSMVQSLSGAAILLASLLSAKWLNNGMLRTASYTSSLAHMCCCVSAPLLFLPCNFKTAFTFWFTYVFKKLVGCNMRTK
jgi:hypothetical protein